MINIYPSIMESNKVDAALEAAYEIAMLDFVVDYVNGVPAWSARLRRVVSKQVPRKRREMYEHLVHEGHWESHWLMANYMLIISKASTLPKDMRAFVEYMGDRAAYLWVYANKKAMALPWWRRMWVKLKGWALNASHSLLRAIQRAMDA